jgi:Ca2+-binding RTX toxin-like protein
MRIRALLILATTLLGVMALSGAALAATKTCSDNPCVGTKGPDRLKGTDAKNEIRGLAGPDYVAGKPRADELYGGRDEVRAGNGRDRVFGGRGRDQLYGGGGNDTMNARDDYKDNVNCGLGTDTAYVDRLDRVNEDCENVFVSGGTGPNPVVDKVSGKGELGSAYGNPRLRVNAESAGTNPDDAQGTFSITYPGNPDVARDNTYIRGTIRCLAVTANEARLVGRVGSASGPRADNGTFEEGEYVRIGVLDAGDNDKANFSAGEQTFTSCNGETPNLDVLEGNFVVEEDVWSGNREGRRNKAHARPLLAF